ncbi:ABC transporter ATP-binding protein [Phytomonospora endophytica]|uniref:ABC-type quaternary amine transporter n=1 Tax=Phytomonospora endophytica TaxID=714109 RepID=A0A841FSF0_9ACTN|nr:ABC transporter ATP-binding protein [Phytomonospora endophytica]MBB6039195.1 osmoprotectant transport system ATP-binding protein [Phytomonospora endophytica]GIG67568.1 ABC transporter [Phytomonospora endophytica]
MSDDVGGVQIDLRNLTKRYPGQAKPAVDDVTMTIQAGEIVVFVGPSGSGKTTTMKLINRLIEPTSGEILINGEDARKKKADELRRHIGYVIQAGGLFPHMTVADNIAIVPRILKWDRKRIAERVEELLTMVGLEPEIYTTRYPRQLSGGQQQRVGVARALAADPPVLLMDEPFGAVDPITRAKLQDELLALQDELSKTIVFVTHDFDEAVKLGDRIAVLAEGSRIVQYAEPAEILANPADDFVRGFIGENGAMKLLNVTRVADIDLDQALTVAPEADAAEVHRELADRDEHWAVVLDRGAGRPVRWVNREELADASGPVEDFGGPVDVTISGRSTLQEALEALLRSDAELVPVVVKRRYRGLVTLNTVQQAIASLREKAKRR